MILELGLAGVLAYAALVEPALLFHRRFTIRVRNLPAGWEGARIRLVTDLHCNRWTSMENRLATILGEQTDLLLLGGDTVANNRATKHIARLMEGASFRIGAFGVLGNAEHKHWVDSEAVVRDMESAGIRMLMNESVTLWRDGDPLYLLGVDDPYTGKADLHKALEGCPEGFRLLLAHAPQVLKDPSVSNIDLILCGHTHGGQVRVPIIGGLLAHGLFERKWSDGHYYPEQVRRELGYAKAPHVYVSRGVGTGIVHLRLMCPPEVQTITLRGL